MSPKIKSLIQTDEARREKLDKDCPPLEDEKAWENYLAARENGEPEDHENLRWFLGAQALAINTLCFKVEDEMSKLLYEGHGDKYTKLAKYCLEQISMHAMTVRIWSLLDHYKGQPMPNEETILDLQALDELCKQYKII